MKYIIAIILLAGGGLMLTSKYFNFPPAGQLAATFWYPGMPKGDATSTTTGSGTSPNSQSYA